MAYARSPGAALVASDHPPEINWYTRLAASVVAVLGFPTFAYAAPTGVSDLDILCLVYVLLVVPTYVLLIIASFLWRSPGGDGGGPTAGQRIRSCANLLPITTVVAFLVYEYGVKPLLPPHYSDIGFFATWGCILSPLPLALLANYWLPRWPKLHRAASSLWWVALHGAIAGAFVSKAFF